MFVRRLFKIWICYGVNQNYCLNNSGCDNEEVEKEHEKSFKLSVVEVLYTGMYSKDECESVKNPLNQIASNQELCLG